MRSPRQKILLLSNRRNERRIAGLSSMLWLLGERNLRILDVNMDAADVVSHDVQKMIEDLSHGISAHQAAGALSKILDSGLADLSTLSERASKALYSILQSILRRRPTKYFVEYERSAYRLFVRRSELIYGSPMDKDTLRLAMSELERIGFIKIRDRRFGLTIDVFLNKVRDVIVDSSALKVAILNSNGSLNDISRIFASVLLDKSESLYNCKPSNTQVYKTSNAAESTVRSVASHWILLDGELKVSLLQSRSIGGFSFSVHLFFNRGYGSANAFNGTGSNIESLLYAAEILHTALSRLGRHRQSSIWSPKRSSALVLLGGSVAVASVADFLGVSRRTIYNWVQSMRFAFGDADRRRSHRIILTFQERRMVEWARAEMWFKRMAMRLGYRFYPSWWFGISINSCSTV